ncbi:GntR family transcriptional regulator [Ligilactobacillus sp. WILCCON 0076]|uniref:GntR family transcriptional regulator n=1 Tax=Ligilactobacillus ubinensis TaxID=2876789 RepID=A0A9X2FKP8_9LACO|nr:GntR family transcriptional regulator [Ligilactobacillus ubinensis]MCP0887464.1 GntR family transcriptional regulator [Ligilactobacillus ubinensis]
MILKYQEIASDLLTKINNAFFTNKLPPEPELMHMYMVSRNTIRNALNVLVTRGVLRRVQGSGYYINQTLPFSGYILDLADKKGINEIYQRLLKTSPKTKVLKLFQENPSVELKKLLACDDAEKVYHVMRVHSSSLDKNLTILEETYLRCSFVPYLPTKACKSSITKFIEKTYNWHIKSALTYFSLHDLTNIEAELMQLPAGKTVLQREEINYQDNEIPISFAKNYYPATNLKFLTRTVDELE